MLTATEPVTSRIRMVNVDNEAGFSCGWRAARADNAELAEALPQLFKAVHVQPADHGTLKGQSRAPVGSVGQSVQAKQFAGKIEAENPLIPALVYVNGLHRTAFLPRKMR